MIAILSSECRPVLEALARERALLVFDFDGTLAPFVPDRDAAELPPETRRLLRAVSVLYPSAVVSGRSRSDVAARLKGIPLAAVVGNHGAEAGHGPLDRTQRARLVVWKKGLLEALRDEPGVELEDKHFSLAVHYRGAPSRAWARHAVLGAAAALGDEVRVFGGRAVVNVIPRDAPDKAAAVEEVRRRTGARRALYVGDDRTDESVFGSAAVEVGVRVGRTGRSRAGYYVPNQESIDDLLRALIDARTRTDGRGERSDGLIRAIDS